MKWLKWIALVGAFLAMLYYTALPGELVTNKGADGDGIAGTYTVNGEGPTGIEYSGTVVITTTDNTDLYEIQWIVTGAIDTGTARLSGAKLSVDWESVATSGEPMSGAGDYTINADGHIVGTRGVTGSDALSTEEFFPES